MTTLVKVLKMVEIENIGQGGNFSQKIKNTSALLSRKGTFRHFQTGTRHIGTFTPGRHSSALLSPNKSLKIKLVNAEKENISKTSEKKS